MSDQKRKVADCRTFPSEKNCDLVMSGSEEHLVPAAVDHAVNQHGHERTPELEVEVRSILKDEE